VDDVEAFGQQRLGQGLRGLTVAAQRTPRASPRTFARTDGASAQGAGVS
jgi:hypothetical protein